MTQWVRDSTVHEVVSETGNVFVYALAAGEARYVVAVNGLSRPCRWYGHFGRTLGQGVAQTATLTVDATFGKVGYRLPAGERLELIDDGARERLRLPLEPAGGAVLLFLPEAIADLDLDPVPETVARGQWLTLSGKLSDMAGAPVPGVVPVRVEILDEAGEEHLEGNGYGAFVDGRWQLDVPLAVNEIPGLYHLQLTELASGQSARLSWRVE